jgi:hypothetical protein
MNLELQAMSPELQARVDRFRADYAQHEGQPFKHFYCPVLFRDENVELCEAHIVNKAFRDTARAWTVQRADVDNFFGGTFEGEFTVLQDMSDGIKLFENVFADSALHRNFKPQILLDGQAVGHFFETGQVSDRFTPLIMEQGEQTVSLWLKMHPDTVAASTEGNWEIEVTKDIRVPTFVSLVKAAHLTLFALLGYRYALSAAGEFVGNHILGEFFRQNHGKVKAEVFASAQSFFRSYAPMVRPILSSAFDFQGTITDKMFFICWGSSDAAWAIIVLIRIGSQTHGVMIPLFNHIHLIDTFFGFLKSGNETITVSLCRFEQDRWLVFGERTQITWPKTGILYP